MEQLNNKQAILNLIGKDTVVSFKYATDGMLTYNTLIPKEIKDELFTFEVEVFFDLLDTFFDFETLDELARKKQVFRVTKKTLCGEREEIYFRKYKGNEN